MKMKLHWTTTGRVVYDRKKHLFNAKDVARVYRNYLKSLTDNDKEKVFLDLKKLWLEISMQILTAIVKNESLPDDLNFLLMDMDGIIANLAGSTVYTQMKTPGDAFAWRTLVEL